MRVYLVLYYGENKVLIFLLYCKVSRQSFSSFIFRYPMLREMALKMVVDLLHDSDVVVSTTGMLSRELFEHRVAKEQGHERDFLTVGSMGHASTIALGIALKKPKRQVCGY
jgi:thiamine pyrophosphate-dependent acetolactate synthase large subunit-like protein